MRLFTKPRPTPVGWLRPGDQLAAAPGGELVMTESDYLDMTLGDDDQPAWSVVHDVHDNLDGTCTVTHTRGITDVATDSGVVMREVVEIDPWSYVRT